MKTDALFATTATALALLAQSASAAVIGTYTLNDTDRDAATSVALGSTFGAFTVQGQSEDTTPGTVTTTGSSPSSSTTFSGLADDRYGFGPDGLVINRPNPSDFWFPPSGTGTTTIKAPFTFTITADAGYEITVESFTSRVLTDASVTALYFGTAETSVGYGTGQNFNINGAAGAVNSVSLSSTVFIAEGTSQTFYIDANSNDINSTHLIDYISVNGSVTVVPEPSTALLGMTGLMVALLRRRRS